MCSANIMKVVRTPLFTAGLAIQCLSAALIGILILAIHSRWIDAPSAKFDPLYWGFRFLYFAFVSGFAFYTLAIYKLFGRHAHAMSKPKQLLFILFVMIGLLVAYFTLLGGAFSLYGRGYISWSTLCKVQWAGPGFGFEYYMWWQRNIDAKARATIE